VRLFMLAVAAIAVLAIAQAGTGANNPIRFYCSGPQSEISNWNTDPTQTGGAQTAVLTVPSAECVVGAATYVSTTGNSATTGTITLANNQNLINPVTIPTNAEAASPGFVNMVGSLSASPPPTVVTSGTVSCSNDNVPNWVFNAGSNGQGFCKLTVQPALVDSTAPTVALTSPSDGALVGRTVHFAASATDTGSGVDHVDIQLRPHGATSWQTVATVGPTGTVDWDSSGFNGTFDVRAAAFDKVGLEGDTAPITVAIDSTPPSLTIKCEAPGFDAVACADTYYTAAPIVVTAVSDAGPIIYTTDGSNPFIATNPSTYNNGVSLDKTTTLVFGVADAAGNMTTQTVKVNIDTTAPPPPHLATSTTPFAFVQQTGAGGYVVWYNGADSNAHTVTLSVPSNDDPESGIASVAWPTPATIAAVNGWSESNVTSTSATFQWQPRVSPGPSFTINSTNGAGETSPGTDVAFSIDSNAPTGGVSCDATACSNSNGPVRVTVALSDPQSGIQQIRYTTDGSTPSATNGTPIANGGSFNVEHNATVNVWAVDNVGNESAAISQPVTAAPGPGAFVVNTTNDTDDTTKGDGQCTDSAGACSLRAAIEEANALPAGSTIEVPAGSYQLIAALVVKNGMTITGAGARTTTISQSGTDRVFDVTSAANGVTISGFTLTGGTAPNDNSFLGGDVRNMGNLTLLEDFITQGSADSGGGVSNAGGTLLIDRSTVSGNSALTGGGDSGGVNNWGSAGNGGTAHGALTIRNSTITGNTARLGGGVFSWNDAANTVVIENSTIAGNHVTDRGIGGLGIGDGSATVEDTIIAGNTQTTANGTVASNCGATGIQSLGHNLESGSDCGFAPANNGDLQNTDPKLGALQNNGGQTDTLLPASNSPVVDAGASCPSVDQRGTSRPQGNACDIGAVEVVPPAPASSCGLLGNCGF
jgi:CSLREA domain-containing protein